jgi:hypothetical protein
MLSMFSGKKGEVDYAAGMLVRLLKQQRQTKINALQLQDIKLWLGESADPDERAEPEQFMDDDDLTSTALMYARLSICLPIRKDTFNLILLLGTQLWERRLRQGSYFSKPELTQTLLMCVREIQFLFVA